MLKIGLVSAATYAPTYNGADAQRTPGSFHGTAFAATFNGYDVDKMKELFQSKGYTFAASGTRIEDAQVVKVWDPNQEAAGWLADVTGIEQVCDSPEECADGTDAVVIVDDGSGEQWKYAVHPLQKGIPTFCDKPLAMSAAKAKEIAAVARETGTKFMSASSLRFIPDIVALRDDIANGAYGNVPIVSTACGNDLIYYGMHALSTYLGVFPHDKPISCLNVGQEGRNIVRVRFASNRDLIMVVGEQPHMSAGWQITIYGQKGWKLMQPDLTDLYMYLLRAFMDYLTKDECSVPIEEEVEVIATCQAGKISLQEGREVTVAEVLEG